MKNIFDTIQSNVKQYANKTINAISFKNKNKLNIHSKVEPLQTKTHIKKGNDRFTNNKNNDYIISVLADIEEIVLDTILFKSNINFKNRNYKLELEAEIKKSNCYEILENVSLLKYIVDSDSNVNLEPYNNHFNTIISVLQSHEWLVLADDDSFIKELAKLVKEPLNTVQNDVTYSKSDLDEFNEKLVEIVNAKENFLNKIENYMENGTNKPEHINHTNQLSMAKEVAKFRKQNLSVRQLLKEQSAINMNYYTTKLNIYIDEILMNTIQSFMGTDKLSTSLKFQDLFTFIQSDFLSAVSKYKPLNISSSDNKQEYLGKSRFYSYLGNKAVEIKDISDVFLSLDYVNNPNNIIKFQHYRNGLIWISKLLNLLKDSDVTERDLFVLFEKNFIDFVRTSKTVVQNEYWSENDWSIRDSISKWSLDVIAKNSNLDINTVSDALINSDTPLDIAYRNTTTISFYHLLDLTIDTSLSTYLEDTMTLLVEKNYLDTQEHIVWYLNYLKCFENVNRGNGLLVSNILKHTNNFGSFELVKDNQNISKDDFNVILNTCYRLVENDYLSFNEKKQDFNVLIDYYKVYNEKYDVDINNLTTNAMTNKLIGEGE